MMRALRGQLQPFADLLQDTSKYTRALDKIDAGLSGGSSCREMSETLGTGVTAFEAVPMAIYCALRHADSFERVIHEAVFIGGDTDTIASMAGAIAGAHLGEQSIPPRWRAAIREESYPPDAIASLADQLLGTFSGDGTIGR
jgi:poly(ADP-ribose) glycohydrolase ARH3